MTSTSVTDKEFKSENVIVPTSNEIISPSRAKCEETLEDIVKGDVSKFPEFATKFVEYLMEDSPQSNDPFVVVRNLSMKGMYILQKTKKLCDEQEEKEIEKTKHKMTNPFAKNVFLICLGYLLSFHKTILPATIYSLKTVLHNTYTMSDSTYLLCSAGIISYCYELSYAAL